MAHAGEDAQRGVRECLGEGVAAGDIDEPVGVAVDDQDGCRHGAQRSGAVARAPDCVELPRDAFGVVAAVPDESAELPDPRGVELIGLRGAEGFVLQVLFNGLLAGSGAWPGGYRGQVALAADVSSIGRGVDQAEAGDLIRPAQDELDRKSVV